MTPRLYSTTEKAWDGMLSAIKGAKSSIYWEGYIFMTDTNPVHNFIDALIEKARCGVEVIILIDAFGSSAFPQEVVYKLKEAGAEILFAAKWFRRIHRKILIVDESSAFVGSANIGNIYRKWLDLLIEVSGPIVASLVRSFAKSYKFCGGENVKLLDHIKKTSKYHLQNIGFIEHFPKHGVTPFQAHYVKKIRQAQKSIVVVSPYFIPHRWLIREFHLAVNRGVSISIILPIKGDSVFMDFANYLFADTLQEPLIQFYLIPVIVHAKALLIDESEGLVGSQNIDGLSFNYNVEAGIYFREKGVVDDLSKILEEWKSMATNFNEIGFKKKWYHYILEPIIWILQPVI